MPNNNNRNDMKGTKQGGQKTQTGTQKGQQTVRPDDKMPNRDQQSDRNR